MSADRIAVLGAGPMGLGVAYQLVKDGRKPIIFEADDRVGGMAACFDFGGLSIERYYHFHAISDHAFLKVLQELGLEDKMHWRETKMGYFYQDRVQPWGNPIALLKFKGLSLTAKIRYGLHAFLCTRRDDWKPLDKLEATEWIRRWVGEEAWEVLWRRLFDYKFYDYARSLSAAWIWSRVRRIGRSRYNLFKEKLGYLDGGSDTLLEGMRRYIEANGGEFRLGTPVTKVSIDGGKVTSVEAGGQVYAFDKVISTIPLPYVPRVMPDLPGDILAKFASVKNVAVVCVIAKLRKPVTENFWLNTNDPDMDIPGIVEYTNLRPLDAHVVYVPFYVPGEHPVYQQSDSVFIDKVKRYLMKINPDIAPDDFIDIRASRYRFAQPVCEPGFADRLPPIQLPVQGLLVADTSYYYPEDRGISESIGLARQMARMV
ncbi:NAD(P)/FAD-dependent oxidoreductase [Burkholderia multivorans]|uniref:NAD(P)/FAD-dependent oxidoreductase n=1 Tax=Burkholderia multivorans TaxID=87883 RepID=UPI000B5A9AC9|nr:NAD(P)/FAD-dependent oxidoreductase [Burkholderia multivorans]MCA8503923.1 NAD(P)/FAD-dependent oxidoreductase [Burkholderia multivorans]MDN8082787.1 NAD(P)/FAD-dependent oxidoreductase [Burkholderia multivorans]